MIRRSTFARLISIGTLALLLTCSQFGSSLAQDSVDVEDAVYGLGASVVVFDGPLNLRAEPSLDSDVVASLAEGDVLTIAGGPQPADDVTWYEINTVDDETGWVAGAFIEPALIDAEFVTGDDVVVSDGPVNLRAAAGTSAAILGELEDGASAIIVSGPNPVDSYNWYEIDLDDGRTGWVAGDFLGLASEVTETTDEEPVANGFGVGSTIFVNTDALNVRSEASLDADVLETLVEGQYGTVFEGPVTADDIDWYRVSIATNEDSLEGWVSGEFLSGGLTLNESAVVFDGPLNLRDAASLDGNVVTQLDTDAEVQVISGPTVSDDVAWMEITAGDQSGFVAGQFLDGRPQN